jgi:SpoVK/Ycf46/Vps4 family AAA+-type ATPase
MTVRHIVRTCADISKNVSFWTQSFGRRADDDSIAHLFAQASENSPSVILLEDIDSLTREAHISRSALLAELDGLAPREGVLVVATTNHPEDLDPALLHRPSRFDRVWHFKLPDRTLRLEYIARKFPQLDDRHRTTLAERTSSWSFAYLNELRVSASVLAAAELNDSVAWQHVEQAHVMLASQFKAGEKGHVTRQELSVGFIAA